MTEKPAAKPAAKLPVPTPEQLKQIDEKVGIVHMISGKDANGKDFYAYISVKPSRYEDFILISRVGEEMNLEEFGKILKKGFGREPSPEVRRQMEEEHGVDHDFLANLQKEIERNRKI